MLVDIVVGAVILLSALISFFRGFIREILTIAGVVGGLLAAIVLGTVLAPPMRGWLGAGGEDNTDKLFDIVPMVIVADVLAYGVIFVAVVIALSVLSHFTAGAAKALGLGPVDRTLGVIFGVVRGVVLLGLAYLLPYLLMDQQTKDDLFKGSASYYYLEKTAVAFAHFLPEAGDVEETAKERIDDRFREKLREQQILGGLAGRDGVPEADSENAEDAKAAGEESAPAPDGYDDAVRQEMDRILDDMPADDADSDDGAGANPERAAPNE